MAGNNSRNNITVDAFSERLAASRQIPYNIIQKELNNTDSIFEEFSQIAGYYKIYREGAKFLSEGTSGYYVPSLLRYKTAASLINKQARFLFAETPDIVIDAKGDAGTVSEESKQALTSIQDLVNTILKENKFSKILLQAAKDCFIGKRVACVVNFNREEGVTVQFLNSLSFIFETDVNNPERLTKFVSFSVVNDARSRQDKRIYIKRYEMIAGICYIEEVLYDGAGEQVAIITELQPTLLDRIPAAILINDGLLGDNKGVSEIALLEQFESLYSKLSNADVDAERKSMNPIRYTLDMDSNSTKTLSTSAGSYWDLQTDQNVPNPRPQVGLLESSMSYSNSLGTTLDRLKESMYEQVDVPNITLENMTGILTSGKTLKAVYWPLIVRGKEKMTSWGPQLEYIINVIIDGAMLYPDTIIKYTDAAIIPVAHEIHIVSNYPLPEDEIEEKQIDLSEVGAQTMSKKSYMRKWRELTEQEADEELEQIQTEQEMMNAHMYGGGATAQGEVVEEVPEEEQSLFDPNEPDEDTVSEEEFFSDTFSEIDALEEELNNIIGGAI